jgi:RNase adapter protein RapZ
MKTAHPPRAFRQLVLITGLSGSGKASALKAFEDLGFYCIDNLPVNLIPRFVELCERGGDIGRAAVVADIRGGEALSQLPSVYQHLTGRHPKPDLVFMEASDEVLIRRFEETRRPHPLGGDLPIRDGIRLERELMKPMRQLADAVISTTRMNVHELRDFIHSRFGGLEKRRTMLISVVSFGFRFGVPTDSDLVFDVRFLPNPNYQPRLKSKTGRDRAVQRFVESHAQTQEFMRRIMELLFFLLPNYLHEGKSYLTIAVGCTGGRHRSVALAERIGRRIGDEGYKARITHRDIGKAPA